MPTPFLRAALVLAGLLVLPACSSPSTSTTAAPSVPAPPSGSASTSGGQALSAPGSGSQASPSVTSAPASTQIMYVTGYTYYDNTPPGSATISNPVVHSKAGGSGTWADPITVAVGHRYVDGRDVLDIPEGTRLYLYYLSRYAVVEDTCGDGPHPERGPCHVHPSGTTAWIDLWIDGKGLGSAAAGECASDITGNHKVEVNPSRWRTVVPGAVSRRDVSCGA